MPSEDEALRRLRDALTRIAATEVDEAIADAIASTRERTVPLVRGALVTELLSRLGSASPAATRDDAAPISPSSAGPIPHATPSPPGRVQGTADRSGTANGARLLYLYGITRPGLERPLREKGVGATSVHTVRLERIAALTSSVSETEFGPDAIGELALDLDWLERNARAHEAVLREAGAAGPVLPLRFGTVYSSEARLVGDLRRIEGRLKDALDAFAVTSEWAVRASVRVEPPADALPAVEPGPGSGIRYLHARRSWERERESRERALDRCATTCHRRMEALAVRSHVGRLPPRVSGSADDDGRDLILNAAYLVESGRLDGFHMAASSLQSEFEGLDLRVDLDGPLPPFHFVPSDLVSVDDRA